MIPFDPLIIISSLSNPLNDFSPLYRSHSKNRDIRSIVPKPPGKIFAIFKKPIGAPLYTQLTYKSKNISITKKCLPKELLTEVDTSLLEDNNNSDDNEPA